MAEITKQARSGMNRDGYTAKDDEEIYFDCNVLETVDGSMAKREFDNVAPNAKKDKPIDLMDFISQSDFSSVGGVNNAGA